LGAARADVRPSGAKKSAAGALGVVVETPPLEAVALTGAAASAAIAMAAVRRRLARIQL
jgi:hypothetical protein